MLLMMDFCVGLHARDHERYRYHRCQKESVTLQPNRLRSATPPNSTGTASGRSIAIIPSRPPPACGHPRRRRRKRRQHNCGGSYSPAVAGVQLLFEDRCTPRSGTLVRLVVPLQQVTEQDHESGQDLPIIPLGHVGEVLRQYVEIDLIQPPVTDQFGRDFQPGGFVHFVDRFG